MSEPFFVGENGLKAAKGENYIILYGDLKIEDLDRFIYWLQEVAISCKKDEAK